MGEFAKMKVGSKSLENAILNLASLKQLDKTYTNKAEILKALSKKDLPTIREISNYFYRTCGIYQRVCNYFAYMYRYDWYVVPEIYDVDPINEVKTMKEFSKTLTYLDNSNIKKSSMEIARKVIVDGCYYGYAINNDEGIILQDLHPKYCRSRYNIGNRPAIEFNLKFFDDKFSDIQYRLRVLKLFPPEFAKAYVMWKEKKLKPDYQGDEESWYLLDPECTVKFSMGNSDFPIFINAIPAILDLEAAQDLDRRKQMQKLLKILIQKFPLDKNGDLVFDIDEMADLHANAVNMLSDAIGVDILTTVADVDSVDLSDKNTTATQDDLAKNERTVYNNLGVSQNLFNTDGNLSLEKSILSDESSMRIFLLQLQTFYDYQTQRRSTNKKKYNFRLYMLETTQYNYKEMAKLYKEQTNIGYSKMLPQIALGHSQSSILNSIYFENDVLHLASIMIPPISTNTINGEDILGKTGKSNSSKNQESSEGGRPELPEDQKSDKTLANEAAKG